jgi:hypothetical protein
VTRRLTVVTVTAGSQDGPPASLVPASTQLHLAAAIGYDKTRPIALLDALVKLAAARVAVEP